MYGNALVEQPHHSATFWPEVLLLLYPFCRTTRMMRVSIYFFYRGAKNRDRFRKSAVNTRPTPIEKKESPSSTRTTKDAAHHLPPHKLTIVTNDLNDLVTTALRSFVYDGETLGDQRLRLSRSSRRCVFTSTLSSLCSPAKQNE